MSIQEISANDLSNLISQESLKLIDVRTPGEFQSSHIANSLNVPISSTEFEQFLNSPPSDKIILICQGGARAKTACGEITKKTGLAPIVLSGGISNWEKAGLDLIRGEGAISMERQVRIAAGLFVFVGSILSILISSNFVFGPLFVGGGLVFSGVTNTCGMARILGKMPWNNLKSESSCCSDSKRC